MDPITAAIIAALATGVAAGAGKVAEGAVSDAYKGLKAVIVRKFGHDHSVTQAITNLEQKPDSTGRRSTLQEEVADANVAKDPEILAAAEALQSKLGVKPQAGNVVTVHGERAIGIGGNVAGGHVSTGDHISGSSPVEKK